MDLDTNSRILVIYDPRVWIGDSREIKLEREVERKHTLLRITM